MLRVFTTDQKVEDTLKMVERNTEIKGQSGEIVYQKSGLQFPDFYSEDAVRIIASKYFQDNETSMLQLVDRVVSTISKWVAELKLVDDIQAFKDELSYICLHQYGAFNSPVWFNVGVEDHPQCSACFINSVEDTMESILNLAVTEGMLFKYGSGTGTNFSPLRSSKEFLSNGGVPSGPVSFMRGYDAFAGVIKSGGKTRRAAKMACLNVDHPDILEFVECKVKEEEKAKALTEMGYDGSFGGEAYASIAFQNANNSVRVSDDFMRAVQNNEEYETKTRRGEKCESLRAKDVFQKMAKAAWSCGDPGIQFDTTVNNWNTVSKSGRINASNPCSEFMFLDDSACNLASINLLKFLREDGSFDSTKFRYVVDIFIIAQEAIVEKSKYPTEKIRQTSLKFRPLGLGYANLGALLMAKGYAYSSIEGQSYAAAITALMTGEAYCQSARLAEKVGVFQEYAVNKTAMLKVMRNHRVALDKIKKVPEDLMNEIEEIWDDVVRLGKAKGFRNAQVTLLAPTGTIGFMMDCSTTGIEPEMALVKYKSLVGGGHMVIVNSTIERALLSLKYKDSQVAEIMEYIREKGTIEGSAIKKKDLAVFDCAFKPMKGERFISVRGHLEMMAAVQPFLSGAISKTVNMPKNSTVSDVAKAYEDAWKLGLKAVAIYRDGSKGTQPVSVSGENNSAAKKRALRVRLPDDRNSLTHKFTIGGIDGYLTVGLYEDGKPGEIFIMMAKQGSVIRGLMDSFATSISIALQYGVPLEVLVEKFQHTRFEPAGLTGNKELPMAKSIVDYVFSWLNLKFLKGTVVVPVVQDIATEEVFQAFQSQEDAPACAACGALMVRNGACYKCLNCGGSSGCS